MDEETKGSYKLLEARHYSKEECAVIAEKLRRGEFPRDTKKRKNGIMEADNVFSAIDILGETGYLEARDAIEKYLYDDDPQIRYIALCTLAVLWGFRDYYEVSKDFLLDPDEDNQRLGAIAIGSTFSDTYNVDVLKFLLKFFLVTDRNLSFLSAVYIAILKIIGVSPRLYRVDFENIIDFKDKVDWELIDKIKSGEQPTKVDTERIIKRITDKKEKIASYPS